MKKRTVEWITKAEGDWSMAQRERQAADPVWDGVCFHVQQRAEKYLKALLEEQIIVFRKTHDLIELVDLSGGQLPELDSLRTKLAHLSMFGIATRYPGIQATPQAADEALQTAEAVRRVVRPKLGLS
jgi:HEPN domain-containing protein